MIWVGSTASLSKRMRQQDLVVGDGHALYLSLCNRASLGNLTTKMRRVMNNDKDSKEVNRSRLPEALLSVFRLSFCP
jgi:hypothetical protein